MATATAYTYKGRTAEGKVVKGRVDASSEGAVVSRLRTMGVSPITIAEAREGTGLQREISFGALGGGGVSLKEIAVVSRQMATMIAAGLSLLRTLSIIADQVENKTLAKVMAEVRDDVESGVSFSDAVGRHDQHFPPLMVNMIRAGEVGGFLDQALESTADTFEKEVALRSTIKSAMTYPVVVLVMSLVAVVVMLTFIVPIFQDMFTNLGGQLPLPTMLLVHASRAMPFVLPALVVAGVAFSIWWRTNKNSVRVRAVLDPIKLKLPVFGPLLRKIAVARFARNFSNMIGAGVPILTALRIVGEVSGNYVLQEALVEVAESVRQGESIAGPLTASGVFPPMVTQMIAVGEDAGSLEQMLQKVAAFYDQEVTATTESLTSLIEPLLIAFLGVVVGGMIVALYLPIFQITSLIQ
ncbi:type II secretion system F family protein [Frigoribacterium salinisoli]